MHRCKAKQHRVKLNFNYYYHVNVLYQMYSIKTECRQLGSVGAINTLQVNCQNSQAQIVMYLVACSDDNAIVAWKHKAKESSRSASRLGHTSVGLDDIVCGKCR